MSTKCTCPEFESFGHEPGCPFLAALSAKRKELAHALESLGMEEANCQHWHDQYNTLRAENKRLCEQIADMRDNWRNIRDGVYDYPEPPATRSPTCAAPDLAPLTGLPRIPSAIGWKCDCGEDADPVSGAWRWTVSAWEHHHGGQSGHFRATYTPPAAPPATCSWRYYDEAEDFDAECGESFAFEEDPDFKRYPFCPACGGRIQLIKQ